MQPIFFFPSKSVRQSRACSPDTLWSCYTLSSGQYGQGHMAQGHFNVAQTIDSEGKQATCWCVVFEQLDGSRLLIMGDNDLHSITNRSREPERRKPPRSFFTCLCMLNNPADLPLHRSGLFFFLFATEAAYNLDTHRFLGGNRTERQ